MRRRTNHQKTDLWWDGRAVWWPGANARGILGRDRHLWMCAEDLGNEIWAQFRRLERRHGQYEVEPVWIENCSADLREVLVGCLPFNEYRKGLSDAICDFAKLVAQEFALEGMILFDACGGWDRSADPPRLKAAALASIPRDCIVGLGRWTFQVVPPGAKGEESTGRVIRLDRSRLVTFAPPRHWRRALARIRAGLPIIGRSEHEWMMGVGQHKVAEDFNAVRLAYNIHRARLTAPIGWNARGGFRDHVADFHWTTRELRWKRFCIQVRDAILTTVGEVFALIGSWTGEHPRLVWDHLATVQQVEEAEHRIMGTGAPFDDVLKPFMYHSVGS